MYKSLNKIVNQFVARLLKYSIQFKDNIDTFLGLYYRDASLITVYFVVQGINSFKKSFE